MSCIAKTSIETLCCVLVCRIIIITIQAPMQKLAAKHATFSNNNNNDICMHTCVNPVKGLIPLSDA